MLNYFIKIGKIHEVGKFISPLHLKSLSVVLISFVTFSPYTIIDIKIAFSDFMYEYRHMQIGSAAHYHHLSKLYQSIVKNVDVMYPIRFYITLLTSNFGVSGLVLVVFGIYEILFNRKLIGLIILLFCFSMLVTISSWQNVAVRYTLSFLPLIYVLIPFGMHNLSMFLEKRFFNYNYCLHYLRYLPVLNQSLNGLI